jgi:hypothetical protein
MRDLLQGAQALALLRTFRASPQVRAPALATVATAELTPGATAWVEHQGVWFYLPDDDGTPDGVTRIAAMGGGNWVRGSAGFPGAAALHYHVNADEGNDANDGQTAETALATLAEWSRRMREPIPSGTTHTVSIVGDSGEDLSVQVHVETGASVVLDFARPAPVATGLVVSSAVDWNGATQTTPAFTLAALPASFQASGYIGKVAVLEDPASNAGAAWHVREEGTPKTTIGIWYDLSGLASVSANDGDTVSLYALPTMNTIHIDATGGGVVCVRNGFIASGLTVVGGNVQILGCAVWNATFGGGSVTCGGCHFANVSILSSGSVSFDGSMIDALDAIGPMHFTISISILRARMSLSEGACARLFGPVAALGRALLEMSQSRVIQIGDAWSREAGTEQSEVGVGAVWSYQSGSPPAAVGTQPGSPYTIGGTNKATNQLPFFNVANGAGVVVQT